MTADDEYLIASFHFTLGDRDRRTAPRLTACPQDREAPCSPTSACSIDRSGPGGSPASRKTHIANCASQTPPQSRSKPHHELCRCSTARPSSICQQTPVIEVWNRVERMHREPLARKQKLRERTSCATTTRTRSPSRAQVQAPGRQSLRSDRPKRLPRHFGSAPTSFRMRSMPA